MISSLRIRSRVKRAITGLHQTLDDMSEALEELRALQGADLEPGGAVSGGPGDPNAPRGNAEGGRGSRPSSQRA